MVVDIKLTHEQHEMMLGRLGTEEAIRDWLEVCIDQELRRLAAVIVGAGAKTPVGRERRKEERSMRI